VAELESGFFPGVSEQQIKWKRGWCKPHSVYDKAGVTSARRMEKQYSNVEQNIYIQIIKTVICEATDINPGNNQL
jgi:hypothetical protein